MSALHQRFLHDIPRRRDHLRRDGRHHRQDHAHERGAGQPHRARDGELLEVGEAARHQLLPRTLLQLHRRARAARIRGCGALLPGVVLLREGEVLRRRALGRPSDRRQRSAALRKGPRSARDGDAEGDRRPRFRRRQPARRKVGPACSREPSASITGWRAGKATSRPRRRPRSGSSTRADTRSTRRERRRISTSFRRSRPSTPKSCSPGPTTRPSV